MEATARLTNQFRVGYNRFWQQVVQADHNSDPPLAYGLNTGVTDPINFGMPEIRIGGFDQHTLGGDQSWPLYTTPNQTLQFTDSATYVHRQAQSEFWGRIPHRQYRQFAEHLRFRRNSFQRSGKLYHRRCSQQRQFCFRRKQPAHCRVKNHSASLFRTRRVTPRLTIDAGCATTPACLFMNKTISSPISTPRSDWCRSATDISQPYHSDYNNFAPRLGIAWDPSGDGNTVFRVEAG